MKTGRAGAWGWIPVHTPFRIPARFLCHDSVLFPCSALPGLLVRRALPLPRRRLCARRQRRSTHEASAFKVDEGGLFPVADAHHARFLCLAPVIFSCSPSSPAAWRPRGSRKLPREADRCKRIAHVQSRRRTCSHRQSRSTHEAPAFKVDDGDLFLVAGAPHGGPQAAAWLLGSRPLLYSRRSGSLGGRRRPCGGGLFSSLTLLMAAAGGRMAAGSFCVKQTGVHEAPTPKFSSLTLPMAVASGRVAARQQTAAAILAAHAPHDGRRRPRGCRKLPRKAGRCTRSDRAQSRMAIYFSLLALLMVAASGRVAARQQTTVATLAAHAPHGGRRRPRGRVAAAA